MVFAESVSLSWTLNGALCIAKVDFAQRALSSDTLLTS